MITSSHPSSVDFLVSPSRSGRAVVWAAVAWAAATLHPLAAHAQQKLIPAQSSLGFAIRQMGVPVEGQFRVFDAQVAFDPAKPAASRIAFTVDTGSATLGSREADAEMPKPVWFNVAQFPKARFESTTVKALGPTQYEVTGKLSIKGQNQDVKVPVALTQAGTGAALTTTATGVFTIPRLAFKVGENEWADTSMVANEVQVRFKLALTGVPKI